MTTKHSYENGVIKVSFDGGKCAHAGFCFGELHAVFDGDSNPPINLAGASTEEIIRVVEKCPSSALTYQRLDGGPDEVAVETNMATIIPNGPLALRGSLKIGDAEFTRLSLCRCGKSQQKPYCDGSHKQHSFDDDRYIEAEEAGNTNVSGTVSISPLSNGPVLFNGSLNITSIRGDKLCQREKGALCRCGASNCKPFCDGSHKAINFEAP